MIRKRLFQIDALKFMASIIIVCHHFQQNYGFENCAMNFSTSSWGNIVELFFLLSGFVIGMKNDEYSNTSFARFFSKRALRILPLTSAVVILDVIARFLFRWKVGVWYRDSAVTVWMIFKNLLLMQSGRAIPDDYYTRLDPPIWYLSVLLACYVLYWAVLWLSKELKINRRWVFWVIVGGAVGGYCFGINLPFLSQSSFRGYSAFFFGLIVFDLYDHFFKKLSPPKIAVTAGSIILLFTALACFPQTRWMLMDQSNFIFLFVLFPAILLWAISSRIANFVFNRKIWGKLGAISFDIFVCHYVVLIYLRILTDSDRLYFASNDITMCIFAAVMIVIGTLSYFILDRPLTTLAAKASEKAFKIWNQE